MSEKITSVIGLREADALLALKEAGVVVAEVLRTLPPKKGKRGEPVLWRVIIQRPHPKGVVLVVTPEWIPFKIGDKEKKDDDKETR